MTLKRRTRDFTKPSPLPTNSWPNSDRTCSTWNKDSPRLEKFTSWLQSCFDSHLSNAKVVETNKENKNPTSFSVLVFHAISHSVIHFVRRIRPKSHFLTDIKIIEQHISLKSNVISNKNVHNFWRTSDSNFWLHALWYLRVWSLRVNTQNLGQLRVFSTHVEKN